MVRAELTRVGAGAALLAVLTIGCSDSAPELPDEPAANGTTAEGAGPETPSFEQNFVFANVSGDSVFLVPWLTHTMSRPDGVLREAHGWLARSGTWDAFYSERWMTAPSRAPARILPHGDLQLLVGEGDIVDGIIFEDGTRSLELTLGESRASWGGPRGETVDLLSGAAFLGDDRVEGVVLHLARAATGGGPPGGDWALLLSGDSAQFILSADVEHGGESEPVYRGWAAVGNRTRQWPELHLDWTATQAFPPARRDVPSSWRLWSGDASVDGELHAISSDMQAGEGTGPLLPVTALFEVVGEISTADRDYAVHGLVVHQRR